MGVPVVLVRCGAVRRPMIAAPSMSGRMGNGTFVSPTMVTVRVRISSVDNMVLSTLAETGTICAWDTLALTANAKMRIRAMVVFLTVPVSIRLPVALRAGAGYD